MTYGGWEVQNKSRFRKQNNNPENIITSQKTQRQIRQTGRGRYSLRQRHWFGNRLLTADWTRHLSIKVYRTRRSTADSAEASAPVVQMINLVSSSFWCDRPVVRSCLLPNFFFSLFKSRIVKAFIFNKNKEIIKRLKIKYQVGFYTVKIAGLSAIYTTYCKQWQLSALQYCSTL